MKQVWTRLLLGGLCIAATAAAASTLEATFQQLDAEAEKALGEVLVLGAEMALLEESRTIPLNNRLEVLVSIEPSPFFRLEAVQLQVDGKTVSSYTYTLNELTALSSGGAHSLFRGELPAGRHQLVAVLLGRFPEDAEFKREVAFILVSGSGPRVMELRVESGDEKTPPGFFVKEWK
ncbi:MAG: hypothetical protein GXP17_07470 [Gammaproteobacteria bacterium]|nr:hypothetical protein [Gammaproteobacteria bacterium]